MNQFEQFVGRVVKASEEDQSHMIGGKEYKFTQVDLDQDDATIKEIKSLWSNIRFWVPGMMGTMEYRTDRLNVHIEKVGSEYQITRVSFG